MMRKILYLDWIRACACIMVVIIHVFIIYCQTQPFSAQYLTALAVEAFVKASMPVFFLLSGFLLIREYGTVRDIILFYKRRLVKIIPLFVLWSYIYYILASGNCNPWQFFLELINHPLAPPLWFVYSILGLYLATPFISNILVHVPGKYILIFCMFCMLLHTFMPIFARLEINGSIWNFLPDIWLIYFISGYAIRYLATMSIFNKNNTLAIYVSACFAIFFMSFFTRNGVTPAFQFPELHAYDANIFMWLASLAFFLFFAKSFHIPAPGFIRFISQKSYGIYLSHALFIKMFYKLFGYPIWYVGMVSCALFTMVLCVLTEFLLGWLKNFMAPKIKNPRFFNLQ